MTPEMDPTTLTPRTIQTQQERAPKLTLGRSGGASTGSLSKVDWSMRLRFASLVLCTRESLIEGLKRVEWDLLGFALVGAAGDVREHLLNCLEAPVREVIQVFMRHLIAIPEQEVTLAQKLVLESMLQFSQSKADALNDGH